MVDANPPQIYLTISSWWIHGNSSSHFLKSDRRSNSLDARSACCSIERIPWNSQFDSPAPRPGVTMSSQIFIISSTIAAGLALWKANANDRLPRSHSIMMNLMRGALGISFPFFFFRPPKAAQVVCPDHRRTQYKNCVPTWLWRRAQPRLQFFSHTHLALALAEPNPSASYRF